MSLQGGSEAGRGPEELTALAVRLRQGTDCERALLREAEALEAMLAGGCVVRRSMADTSFSCDSPPDSPGLTPLRLRPPSR